MKGFIQFMNAPFGRILRFALGVILVYVGFFTVKGGWGIVIGVVGFVPIIMALWGRCLAEFIGIPIPF